jgi:hypothetical protein
MRFHPACGSTVVLMWAMKSHVGNSVFDLFVLSSPFLPELTRVNELRQVYHGFNDVYQRHVQNAKLESVKGAEFESLKGRLITVCHLLERHPDRLPAEAIQAFLAEDDLRRPRLAPSKDDRNKEHGKTYKLSSSFLKIMGIFSGSKGTDEESPRKKLKNMERGVTDSDFLLQLKGRDDKDLEAPIRRVVDLACTQLSSSIDAAVKKMTQEVLRMQQEECKMSTQRHVETEKRKELGGILVDFIQVINEVSAGSRTS